MINHGRTLRRHLDDVVVVLDPEHDPVTVAAQDDVVRIRTTLPPDGDGVRFGAIHLFPMPARDYEMEQNGVVWFAPRAIELTSKGAPPLFYFIYF